MSTKRTEGAANPDSPEDAPNAARFHDGSGAGATVIPVIQEVASIDKRTVETGRVRVEKSVAEHSVVIDEPLFREDVTVERVAIGREVAAGDEPPGIRYEGETMVIPVLEEVPVVTRKILLTEEIRITRKRREFRDPQTVKVRVEQVSIERNEVAPNDEQTREDDSSSSR